MRDFATLLSITFYDFHKHTNTCLIFQMHIIDRNNVKMHKGNTYTISGNQYDKRTYVHYILKPLIVRGEALSFSN